MQGIRRLLSNGCITAGIPVPEGNIQPASLDLRIAKGRVIRLPGMFLPGKGDVYKQAYRLSEDACLVYGTPVNTEGFMLEVGIPYLLPIEERLDLTSDLCARANNKSSSGRINLQVRLICHDHPEFDMVPAGYRGKLHIVVVAQSFPVHIKPGETLNQIRFYSSGLSECRLREREIEMAHRNDGIIFDLAGNKIPWSKVSYNNPTQGVLLHANLKGEGIVGYRFKGIATHGLWYGERNVDPSQYFEPIYAPKDGGYLALAKGGFYLLSTLEAFAVPPCFCSEMVAYHEGIGEYRSHFAGFFDCGWGYNQGLRGTPAVLEILPHETILVDHGQPVCAMQLYDMEEEPEALYGDTGSHYHGQTGPRLSKHFAQA